MSNPDPVPRCPNIPISHFAGDKGDDFKSWLQNEFEIKFQANGWPEKHKPALLGVHVDGHAKFLFTGLDDTTKADYNRVIAALETGLMTEDRKRFLSDQYDVRTQKQGESVAEYAQALTELARSALSYMTVDAERQTNLRNKFVAGLKPRIREEVKVIGPKNMAEAMIAAERIETKLAADDQVTTCLATISKRLDKMDGGLAGKVTALDSTPGAIMEEPAWVTKLTEMVNNLAVRANSPSDAINAVTAAASESAPPWATDLLSRISMLERRDEHNYRNGTPQWSNVNMQTRNTAYGANRQGQTANLPMYGRQQFTPSGRQICQICGRSGHTAFNCRNSGNRAYCEYHRTYSHSTAECRNRPNQQQQQYQTQNGSGHHNSNGQRFSTASANAIQSSDNCANETDQSPIVASNWDGERHVTLEQPGNTEDSWTSFIGMLSSNTSDHESWVRLNRNKFRQPDGPWSNNSEMVKIHGDAVSTVSTEENRNPDGFNTPLTRGASGASKMQHRTSQAQVRLRNQPIDHNGITTPVTHGSLSFCQLHRRYGHSAVSCRALKPQITSHLSIGKNAQTSLTTGNYSTPIPTPPYFIKERSDNLWRRGASKDVGKDDRLGPILCTMTTQTDSDTRSDSGSEAKRRSTSASNKRETHSTKNMFSEQRAVTSPDHHASVPQVTSKPIPDPQSHGPSSLPELSGSEHAQPTGKKDTAILSPLVITNGAQSDLLDPSTDYLRELTKESEEAFNNALEELLTFTVNRDRSNEENERLSSLAFGLKLTFSQVVEKLWETHHSHPEPHSDSRFITLTGETEQDDDEASSTPILDRAIANSEYSTDHHIFTSTTGASSTNKSETVSSRCDWKRHQKRKRIRQSMPSKIGESHKAILGKGTTIRICSGKPSYNRGSSTHRRVSETAPDSWLGEQPCIDVPKRLKPMYIHEDHRLSWFKLRKLAIAGIMFWNMVSAVAYFTGILSSQILHGNLITASSILLAVDANEATSLSYKVLSGLPKVWFEQNVPDLAKAVLAETFKQDEEFRGAVTTIHPESLSLLHGGCDLIFTTGFRKPTTADPLGRNMFGDLLFAFWKQPLTPTLDFRTLPSCFPDNSKFLLVSDYHGIGITGFASTTVHIIPNLLAYQRTQQRSSAAHIISSYLELADYGSIIIIAGSNHVGDRFSNIRNDFGKMMELIREHSNVSVYAVGPSSCCGHKFRYTRDSSQVMKKAILRFHNSHFIDLHQAMEAIPNALHLVNSSTNELTKRGKIQLMATILRYIPQLQLRLCQCYQLSFKCIPLGRKGCPEILH